MPTNTTYEASDFLVERTKTLPDQIKKFCEHFADLYNNSALNKMYPVGSVYITLNPADPADTIGGTWERIQEGKFLISAGDYGEYYAGSTGGSATQTLTSSNMPSHRHGLGEYAQVRSSDSISGSSVDHIYGGSTYDGTNLVVAGTTEYAGNGRSFEIMPPYLAMYMWIRTD